MSASRLPLGIRNNNPGNLRPTPEPWEGRVLPDDPLKFMRFKTPEDGIRALAKCLLTYQNKRNLRTIERIIARFAPSTENNTEAYIRHVAELTGFRRDELIDVGDPDTLHELVAAIIRHENGVPPTPAGWYTDTQISVGIVRALE